MAKEPAELQPWEPFASLTPLREAMNRLFEESFVGPMRAETVFGRMFPLDVYEAESEYIIEAAIPGVKSDDLQITATDDTITIRATAKREQRDVKKGAYVRRERYEGEMSRSVVLGTPIDASKVSASYEHGVLKVTAPKSEVSKPKQVPVQVH